MRLVVSQDDCYMKRKYLLEIDQSDWIRANLTAFDRILLRDCETSDKISDKLLALETLVRRIEEGQAMTSQAGL